VPELALTLIAACLLAFVAVLELPATILISIRRDDSGFRLNTVIGLLGGVLRLPITSAGDLNRSIPSHGAPDALWNALRSAAEARGDTETSRLSLRRWMVRLVVGAVVNAFGKPGYNCAKLDVRLDFGLAEASETALAAGAIYACLGALSPALKRLMQFSSGTFPSIHVTPNYESVRLTLAIDCIFRISLGYIIRREAARLLRRRFAPRKVA
jgi:hypothetical protein